MERIILKGQRSYEINSKLGMNKIMVKMIRGKVRINHGMFTPDDGTWLDLPDDNRKAHYDCIAENEYEFNFDVCSSFGRPDKIIIVNLHFFKSSEFVLEIY
jgi:hypothetical protein